MKTTEILAETITEPRLKHKEWHVVPTKDNPNSFSLKTNTGAIVCTLDFPEDCNTGFLNLIASAPELQDIAEMYHDYMLGREMQKTIVFTVVREVLHRLT